VPERLFEEEFWNSQQTTSVIERKMFDADSFVLRLGLWLGVMSVMLLTAGF
jgi:hypothetical protein